MDQPEEPTPKPSASAPSPSYSSLSRFRECPQAWNYSHVRRLRIDRSDPARDFGSWWHAVRAMDSIRRGVERESLVWCPSEIGTGAGPALTRINGWDPQNPHLPSWLLRTRSGDKKLPTGAQTIIAIAGAWWRTLTEEVQEEWTAHIGGPLPDRLTQLDERWRARWAPETAQERPVGVEVPFIVDLDGDGWPATLKGFVDEIFIDEKRGLLVQRDHKTHKALQPEEGITTLMDSQHFLYARGVSAMTREVFGRDIEAISYDRVRVTAPKSPQLTAAGSLSKSVTDFDAQTYREWVGDGIPWGEPDTFYQTGKRKGEPKFGIYELDPAVIEKLSDPAALSAWHQRTLQPINPRVADEHWRSARDTFDLTRQAMLRISETGAASRSFDRFKCSRCDFAKLCYAEMIGGPDGDYDLTEYGLTSR